MADYVNLGAIAVGTGDLSVGVPGGYASGDLLVLLISGRDSLPALPSGWTNIATVNNGTDIYNRTCYKFASASESAVTVTDSGAHTIAQMFLFANVDATSPINVYTTNTSDGTSFSATGVTTSVDNCVIVHAIAFQDAAESLDSSNYSSHANANLTALTERYDYYNYSGAGANGGICLISGKKGTAGATGNTTATADSSNNKSAIVTFALTPAAENLRVAYVNKGALKNGTGDISIAVPIGYSPGDLLVLALSGRDAVPALPDGWTNIGTNNNSTYTYCRTCYKIATASESAVTVTDSGVYTAGLMLLFCGNDTVNPINITTTSTDTGTSFAAGGLTTTVDGCLIVHATSFTDSATAADGSNYSGESNANLVSLAETNDWLFYSSEGVEAGIYVLTGLKTAAGATGDTTATADSASNYSATVTFAIQPPQASAEIPEGGSEVTVVISSQGSGAKISSDGSSAEIDVSAESGGLKVSSGGSGSTVIVSVQGAGAKTASGASESPVTVDAEGDGTKTSQGGASVTVTINPDGAGTKIASGSSDVTVTVSDEGSGTKTGSGGSSPSVVIGTQGSGIKTTSDGSESPITISVQGIGKKISSSGSDSTVTIDVQGSGFRVMSGGSEANVIVSDDGSGVAIRLGSSDSTVIVSSEGGGYGTLKTGGANSVVVIGIDGDGSKITSGSSDSTVIITAQGRGRKYKPIVITAVFDYESEVDAVFDYSAEVTAVFNYEAEKAATFNCESEQTAIFNPAITIGGIYGDS